MYLLLSKETLPQTPYIAFSLGAGDTSSRNRILVTFQIILNEHYQNCKTLSSIRRITMCPHHNGFMVNPALGTQEVRLHIVWEDFK